MLWQGKHIICIFDMPMKHSTQSEYWGRERARDGEGEREIESERERDDTFTLTHNLTLMHRQAYKKKSCLPNGT